jgi:hypothetical protein
MGKKTAGKFLLNIFQNKRMDFIVFDAVICQIPIAKQLIKKVNAQYKIKLAQYIFYKHFLNSTKPVRYA